MKHIAAVVVALILASTANSTPIGPESFTPAGLKPVSIVGHSLVGNNLSNSPTSPESLAECSLANTAPDAWNFNVEESTSPPTKYYDHKGTQISGRDMYCENASDGPAVCPKSAAGPGGTNAAWFDQVPSTEGVGLWAENRSWNDYSSAENDAITVTFFFKNGPTYAWFAFIDGAVVSKAGEFHIGEDPDFVVDDLVCADVTGASDNGGAGCTNPSCCGSDDLGLNSSNGVTSKDTTLITDGEWFHFGWVWDGSANTSTVFIDFVQVYQETGITPGEVTDLTAAIQVGHEGVVGALTGGDWIIDDLQIWNTARAITAANTNCKVPD